MCGRYSFYPPKNFASHFSLELSSKDLAKLIPNGNVTPGQIMPIITKNNSSNQLTFLTWGFLPSWTRPDFKPLINARSETLLQKPFFKDAFLANRCLIPSSGFYEWSKKSKLNTHNVIARSKVTKQSPYCFSLKNDSVFSMAGLYSPTGYTIITTSSNSLVKPIHHRMPVILNKENESTWLDPSANPQKLISLMSPLDPNQMSSVPKSPS